MTGAASDEERRATPVFQTAAIFSTPWFEVLERTPVSGGASYFAVKPRDYVSVLAVTTADEIVLVRQFRPVIEQWTWELPSGAVESGEDPDAAIARELREETGYRAVRLERLGTLQPDTGRLANRLFAYFARVEPDPDRVPPEPDEWSLRPELVSRETFLQRHVTGPDALVQALQMAVLHLAAARGVYDVLRR
jgi:8-oxo-dGTP pyrophosphatase MutT (NUDIX family)